jgi:hypothetical protein
VTPGYGGQYARPECIPTRSSGEKATSDPCHANGPCPRNASTRFTGRNLQGFGTDAAGSVSRVWTRSIRPRSVPGAQGEGGGGGAVPTIDRRGASGRRIAVRFLPSAPYAGMMPRSTGFHGSSRSYCSASLLNTQERLEAVRCAACQGGSG